MEGFFFLQSPCGVVAVLLLGEDSLDAAAQLRMKKERGGRRKKKKQSRYLADILRGVASSVHGRFHKHSGQGPVRSVTGGHG